MVLYHRTGSVAELADAEDLKSSEGNLLWVRLPPELLSEIEGDLN